MNSAPNMISYQTGCFELLDLSFRIWPKTIRNNIICFHHFTHLVLLLTTIAKIWWMLPACSPALWPSRRRFLFHTPRQALGRIFCAWGCLHGPVARKLLLVESRIFCFRFHPLLRLTYWFFLSWQAARRIINTSLRYDALISSKLRTPSTSDKFLILVSFDCK